MGFRTMYRNPVPKAKRCEACDKYAAALKLTVTDLQGVLLDKVQVCAVCLPKASQLLEPGVTK